MIVPTVGRVILYLKEGCFTKEPEAALVVAVQSPSVVNLAVFDEYGGVRGQLGVRIAHDEREEQVASPFAKWNWVERHNEMWAQPPHVVSEEEEAEFARVSADQSTRDAS